MTNKKSTKKQIYGTDMAKLGQALDISLRIMVQNSLKNRQLLEEKFVTWYCRTWKLQVRGSRLW